MSHERVFGSSQSKATVAPSREIAAHRIVPGSPTVPVTFPDRSYQVSCVLPGPTRRVCQNSVLRYGELTPPRNSAINVFGNRNGIAGRPKPDCVEWQGH